jgi:hypothetical protein
MALLKATITRPAVDSADPPCLFQPPTDKVACAYESDLALFDELIEHLHRVFDPRIPIVNVCVIEIYHVGSQPPQALFALRSNHIRPQPSLATRIRKADLGRNKESITIATVSHPFAQQQLAFAASATWYPKGIRVRTIYKRTASLDVLVQGTVREICAITTPEVHRSQAQRANLHAGES